MLRSGMYLQNRYEILEQIGSGGMSEVYKARCHKLNRLVAIKVLKAEFSDDASFVSKFKIEAQAAAGLSHPNVVSVYDVVDEGVLHYIVMELIEGITLKNYICKKGRLDVREAIGIVQQDVYLFGGTVGENIAYGQKTPEQVMEGWMNSQGHRANILNPNFTAIGVGYYQNSRGVSYWTQLFVR